MTFTENPTPVARMVTHWFTYYATAADYNNEPSHKSHTFTFQKNLFLSKGFRTIFRKENCPAVRVRIWLRIRVRINFSQFSSGAFVLEPLQ